MRALRLLSGVTYPFLTRPDEFVPTSFGEFADKLETEGFDYINTYLDGTLGLSSLFNTSARATTSADKLAIAGSINVVVFTNVAESIVHSGAQINQDPFYRPRPDFYRSPAPTDYDPTLDDYDTDRDNDRRRHSANAQQRRRARRLDRGDQLHAVHERDRRVRRSSSRRASSSSSAARLNGDRRRAATPSSTPSYDNSLTPARGGKGGVGGAIFLQFLNNTTHAIVETGVELYSGTQSGLNIKAEEAIMSFAFSQAGASSGKVAVGGTFAYFEQDSDTLAQLEEGSDDHRRAGRRLRRQPRDPDQLGRRRRAEQGDRRRHRDRDQQHGPRRRGP